MRNSTIAIILIFALLVVGLSFGGNKIFSNVKEVIEANKDSNVEYVPPEEPKTIIKYVSSSNCATGMYQDSNSYAVSSYFSDKILNPTDFSGLVLHYDFSSVLYLQNFPLMKFGLQVGNSNSINFYEDGLINLGLELYCEEWYDPSIGDGGINYKCVFDGVTSYVDSFESLTYVFHRLDESSINGYIYLNDEYIGVVTITSVPSYIYGMFVSFHTSCPKSAVVFDSIELYGISNDYDGDLYEVIENEGKLTDSEDFNTIINGQ